MQEETKMHAQLAAMVFIMLNAVVFFAGLITVLTVPALSANAWIWIPIVIVVSVAISVPASWIIAPRLRLRYWRQRQARHPHATTFPHI